MTWCGLAQFYYVAFCSPQDCSLRDFILFLSVYSYWLAWLTVMRVNDCSEFWLCSGCGGWERTPPRCPQSSATFLSHLCPYLGPDRVWWSSLGPQSPPGGRLPSGFWVWRVWRASRLCLVLLYYNALIGKLHRSASWPCSFVPMTVCLCMCSLHTCRDRTNKLTGSASRILQNRSGFRFNLEVTNNKGISLQNFTPVEMKFSLVFKIRYF